MTIGVISAMSKEHEQLTSLLQSPRVERDGRYEFVVGSFGLNELVLLQCGIGKVNAAVGATVLIRRFSPDCIISTGCAGGIEDGQNVMDVVVATETAYHDVSIPGCDPGQIQGLPARFSSEVQLLEAVDNSQIYKLTDSRIWRGLIVSGDQFITSEAQTRNIKAAFTDAIAVDMESAAIAQACYLQQVPFVSFRVLSDTPGADEHLQQYFDFWDNMADRSFDVTRRFLAALPERFAFLPFAD